MMTLKTSAAFAVILFVTACAGKSGVVSAEKMEIDNTVAVNKEVETVPSKKTKICKESLPTGSRIPKKTCRTKEAWDEIERVAQQRLDNATKPQTNNPQGE